MFGFSERTEQHDLEYRGFSGKSLGADDEADWLVAVVASNLEAQVAGFVDYQLGWRSFARDLRFGLSSRNAWLKGSPEGAALRFVILGCHDRHGGLMARLLDDEGKTCSGTGNQLTVYGQARRRQRE